MKKTFFTKDPSFYRSFFKLMTVIALQNLVAYSVNMLDNIMLGSYSQNALSGAATVNQIYFIVNQIALAIGNALIAISSQYWGSHQTKPIRKVTKAALLFSLAIAAGIIALCIRIPNTLIGLFTTSPDIIREGTIYLHIIQWTFLFFMISNLLLAMLRSVETVKIAFLISVISLLVNGGINYILIFGRFGAPEMGIRGAAIGTFAARILELGIVLFYVWKKDTKVKLFDEKFRDGIIGKGSGTVWKTFFKVCIPILTSGLLWAVSLPMQTAILGHLSADAIAANSVSSTFFQYLKVIVIAIAGASAVVIGKDIGSNDEEKVRCNGRTLSGYRTLAWNCIILTPKSTVIHVPIDPSGYFICRPLYDYYECDHGWNVLSDAGRSRYHPGWRRYQIFDVSEPDLRLVHCNAIVLSGRILLEAAGRTCGDRCAIRSDL